MVLILRETAIGSVKRVGDAVISDDRAIEGNEYLDRNSGGGIWHSAGNIRGPASFHFQEWEKQGCIFEEQLGLVTVGYREIGGPCFACRTHGPWARKLFSAITESPRTIPTRTNATVINQIGVSTVAKVRTLTSLAISRPRARIRRAIGFRVTLDQELQ
jgi:hypothetical protein